MENSLIKPIANNNMMGEILAICITKTSSSAAFAVFFSGLSLYLTQKELYTKEAATVITGLFLSLNYFLPLIGGMIANRIISYKKLYCLGATVSVVGCLLLAFGINLKIGLSLFLMSSLVTNVCLNMFITTLFREDQITERRIAFIWNYVGMNVGFLTGYLLTGYYTVINSYSHLFMIMSFLTVISLISTLAFIKNNDSDLSIKKSTLLQVGLSLLVMSVLVVSIFTLFSYAAIAQKYMTILSPALLCGMIHYGFKHSGLTEKKKFLQFVSYSGLAIIFWTIYMLTPTAFMQIIKNDVQQTFFGITIAPQWFVIIDSLIILMVAPQLAFLFKRRNDTNSRQHGTLRYFTIAFLFATAAFLILLLGLYASIDHAKLPIWGMLGYLILLTLGEIFISPIGSSLIGELVSVPMRGMMTGAWSINIGVGGLLSSVIANRYMLPYVDKNGLVGANLVQFQSIIMIISVALVVLTTSLFLYGRILKATQGIISTTET